MMSPITAFLSWYKSLPVPHRQEIAAFITQFNLGYEDIDAFEFDSIESKFESRVRQYSEDYLRGVGAALSIRATIEFFLIRHRGTSADWNDTQAVLASAKTHFSSEGVEKLASLMDKSLQELPFRSGQWLASAEKWRTLVNNELSDKAISDWWERA